MKRKNLALLALSTILSLSAIAHAASNDEISCCLAEEWVLEENLGRTQLSSPTEALSHNDDMTCCLAEEWTALRSDNGRQSLPANTNVADGFCCIANEWRL